MKILEHQDGPLVEPGRASRTTRTPSAIRWLLLVLVLLGAAPATTKAQPTGDADPQAWKSLFDGRSLDGWRSNEQPGSFKVEDGTLIAAGPRSHLFYVGPVASAQFRDFEFSAEILARPGANSGVYIHTSYQDSDWLTQGYEIQINNTATGSDGYRENKKTGSLYGIRNVYRQLVPDDQWFQLRIRVHGRRIQVFVNEVQTVDYLEPDNPPTGGYPGRRLAQGTFALQSHDPGSRVHFRNLRVRLLPPSPPSDPAGGDPRSWEIPSGLADLHAHNVPVIDLHTHLKGGLTLAEVVLRQFRTGINAGVAINGGLGFAVTNDATALRALADTRHPLVFTALQAEGREWTRLFSSETIRAFDYVFTDAMTIVNDEGRRMRLWIPAEVEIGEPQAFMDMLVRRTVAILEQEPIDIWVNPTFLPAPLDAQYDELWTRPRMEKVISAAARQDVAIEINARFRLPSPAFVRLAKAAGARFTMGTNNGGRDDLGNLEYVVQVAESCGLTWNDFWVPGQQPARSQRTRP